MGELLLAEQVFQKRQVAHKLRIQDVIQSPYVKQEGEWSPNYIEWNGVQVSRVNIIGVVVFADAQDNTVKSITIDDGTGKILVRSFDEQYTFSNAQVGDMVLLIGRVREYNNEKYIMAEIVKHIDKQWVEVRKLELGSVTMVVSASPTDQEVATSKEAAVVPQEAVEESATDVLLNLIREYDKGEGATTEEIIAQSNNGDAEKIITSLLLEGEIFEVKPGRLKVLE